MGIFTAGLLLSLQVAQTATPVTDSVERAALTQDADTVHRVDYVGQEKTYSSPALAAIVRAAAELNRNAPAALTGYRARVTSEIAMVTRREDGTEAVMAIEQLASAVRWQRPGTFDQDVIGYRSQAIGPNLSALTFMDRPWLVPSLYGNRLALFFGRDTSERGERRRRRAEERRERAGRPPVLAVHPLADDREAVYRYSGGDTIATVRVSGRSIPIVRVYVEPREDLDRRRFVFRGEMDLDVSRHELVRMRGQLLAMDERLTLRERVGRIVAEPIAYVELENQELQGRYWIPARQRVELQVAVPLAGDSRGIMRVVSHFREVELQLDRTLVQADSQRQLPHAPDDSAGASGRTRADAAPDSLQPAPFTLRVAGADTLAEFDDWPRMIGDATAGLRADDFDDVAPERYRSTGEPRLEFGVNRASDVAHFNRVEGLYTGAGARWRFRDAMPGLALHANAGWAWSEETVRGRVGGTLDRARWSAAVTAGRRLDMTNDFRVAFDSGSSFAAIFFSADDYDYVDRRFADLRLTRKLPGAVPAALGVEFGIFDDAGVSTNISRGLFEEDSGFRANRGVDEGTYARSAVTLRSNSGRAADFLNTGASMELRWERGRGDLNYDRLEVTLSGRSNRGPWTLAARADGGALLGDDPPAQQLFEIGGHGRLPGYDYKVFGGNEAALAAGMIMWTSPLLRAPLIVRTPVVRRLILPAPAPALAITVQNGWTRFTRSGARAAALRLGTRPDPDGGQGPLPIVQETDGVRTTVELQLRLFGGAIGLGIARAVDRRDGWSVGLVGGNAW